jgi:hypothetical protein
MKTPFTKKVFSLFKNQSPNPLKKFCFLGFVSVFLSELLFTNSAFAWSGYDFENRTAIEIDSGNLVREGQVIQFYDLNADDFYSAQVIMMESAPGGVRITVDDLDNKKKRTLIMNE